MVYHTEPLCGQTEPLRSPYTGNHSVTLVKTTLKPRVDQGFPYNEYHTETLWGQTKPLRTPNTQNRCVTVMENNCEGPVLIRVSPL